MLGHKSGADDERQAISHGITGRGFRSAPQTAGCWQVAEALRMTNAGLDYLNGPGAGELDAAACGLGAAVAG